MKKIQRCICPTSFVLDGEERIEWPDPDCSRHGLPDREHFPSGHPLARHAKIVDKETGERLTFQAAHALLCKPDEFAVDCVAWAQRFRHETPRETEQRLYHDLVQN